MTEVLKVAFAKVNRFEGTALMGSCISLKWSWKGRLVDAALRRIKRQLCLINCNGDWERQEADVTGFLKGILGECFMHNVEFFRLDAHRPNSSC